MAPVKGSERSSVYWIAIIVAVRCRPLVTRACKNHLGTG